MILSLTRHALIACRYLVEAYYQNRYVPAPEIAGRYHMNVRALMPGLNRLTRVGILRSRVGGSEPGFIFCCDPQEIQMLDVITALEGDQPFVCCRDVIPGIECDCKGENGCKIYRLMSHMLSMTKAELAKITLKDYSDTEPENKRKTI